MRRAFALTIALSVASPLVGQGVTADQLWTALLQGNRQFVAGSVTYDKLKDERALLRGSELPPVTVLSCADSRVPPELVFNQSLGAMFVVRTSAGVADDLALASIEFALTHGWTKLLVVMGHENCDAVHASLAPADPASPALKALATRIRSSFAGIPYDQRDPANVRKAVEANTRASAAHLLAASSALREAVSAQKVKIVTAYYELETGVVRKLE